MRTGLPVTLGLLLGLGPAAAGAEEAPVPAGGAEPGYCRWVRGASDSEASLLLAPELFGRAGFVNVGESVVPGVPLGDNSLRVTAGLRYSVSGFFQGLTLRQRADAECERYKAQAALQEALHVGRTAGARKALAERAAFLGRTLPQAEARVQRVKLQVEHGEATVEELNALQLKLDALRSLARQTEADRAKLADRTLPEVRVLPALVKRFSEAEGRVERLTAAMRQTSSWDVTLQGGYDRLFGVEQGLPFFAFLSVSYNVGGFFQFGADHQARQGRVRFVAEDVQGVDRRTGEMLADLRGAYTANRARLGELDVLVEDLRQQLSAVEQMQTEQVRRYRDALWFELARLEAEEVYLKAHVSALDGLLGEEQP
jgi:hypothetical protein